MDIEQDPTAPDGNLQTADAAAGAATGPQAVRIIHRADYRPPAWLVPDVSLDFKLGLDQTIVTATLDVVRNPAADHDPVIRLNGDGLAAQSVVLDGATIDGWVMDGADLLVNLPGDTHRIEVVTQINPAANSQLMGLYASGGMLCTQCEAEGFRRIIFFPDRPDVLSIYQVRMSGDKALFPVLLANGNCTASGDGANGAGDDGTHWAQWHDPWPKPAYLFALVAGDLVADRDSFTTMGGRKVDLAIWVRDGDLDRTAHAMRSLKQAMAWDERIFGREYDLGIFNIVAVSDFNMGAMENKGLNIFNTRYVLADPETATDGDYDGVEGVIAHEYFHNWSGNRVTCRDWFQLSLKEGFTVLRDQLFSQDMGSEAVKRIEDVRILRVAQFPEDSGPLAHPIRPDNYQEITNFYSSTVYNKGAEVIRMMRTMAGEAAFRKGCDLYFERHDGEAATCEDFVTAIEDGTGLDLGQFRRWYSQAGTPKVSVRMEHGCDIATIHLTQTVPATPGQPDKKPMPVPLRMALFDADTGAHCGEELVVLDNAETELKFPGFSKPPILSLNRGFSAPVTIERHVPEADLVFLAAHDDDPFARYEAMQNLVVQHLIALIDGKVGNGGSGDSGRSSIVQALSAILVDPELDDLMRGELMILPGTTYLAEQMQVADPEAIHIAREGLKAWLGRELQGQLAAMHERACALPYGLEAAARGARKLKTQALVYLAAADPSQGAQRAADQYRAADNMTDRQGALMVLASLDVPERAELLADFRQRYDGNALVTDKWFSIQAASLHPQVLAHVRALADHPDFTLHNPNRVRSLYMAFAANPHGFHAADGEGYRMIADLILELDSINAQTAARFVPPLGRWRRIETGRSALMRAQLERIAAAPRLSRDTYEQVARSLG